MNTKTLKKVLDEVPILMVDACFINNLSTTEFALRGMAVRREREDGSYLRYTILNKDCDDVGYTLLHESTHHIYKHKRFSEEVIENLTDYYWGNRVFRKLCQNRIVELHEKYNL